MHATQLGSTEEVLAKPFAAVVRELVPVLGGPSVAVIGGVSKTSAVGEWMRGERVPRSEGREQRLRLALRLALIIKERFENETVRAWFMGANHRLDDEMPIALLAKLPLEKISKPLLSAARGFIQL